jgi:hypothetical protein
VVGLPQAETAARSSAGCGLEWIKERGKKKTDEKRGKEI